ncbi:MAG: DUF4426 domain-containing protein [Gammaproteobacteria bacterium]|nr:DUF4426 domain-containing protein [Gammaproteobacteria bacterium]
MIQAQRTRSARGCGITAVLALSVLLSACGGADQQVEPELAAEAPATLDSHRDFGDYRIHFNALSTDSLAPQVAMAYGIVRSKSRAMLNISVMRREDEGLGTPVKGKVTVNASNLSGQLKVIKVREIVEGEGSSSAIYYIGELPVADGETLIFDVAVVPENETSSYRLRFQKQFFTG